MYCHCQRIICLLWMSLNCFILFSQESPKEQVNEEESLRGAHRFTTGLGHTHLAKGKNVEGKIVWLTAPSWSFNYDHWISNKWAIGLQTDLVMEEFIVEDADGKEMERNKPFAIIPVGIFKPFKHFSFLAGAGVELEKEENLGLTRLGAEYGCGLPKGWEAGIGLFWDNKWGHYNSWVLEFTFSKNFFRKEKK